MEQDEIYAEDVDWKATAENLQREVTRLATIAGGGRCHECGQVEPIMANGRLAPHHDAATDDICEGSGGREHEPPNLEVRVLDNDDRKELDRLRVRVAELEAQRSAVLGFLDDVNREEWASKVLISTAIRSAYGVKS
jgi:hypothetical protein